MAQRVRARPGSSSPEMGRRLTCTRRASTVHLTLLESDQSFLRSAELITLSIAMHVTVLAVAAVASPFGLYRDAEFAQVRDVPAHRADVGAEPAGQL